MQILRQILAGLAHIHSIPRGSSTVRPCEHRIICQLERRATPKAAFSIAVPANTSRHTLQMLAAGDLKPENIFFDSQAVLKLGDFGLAKFTRRGNDNAAVGDEDTGAAPPAPQTQRRRIIPQDLHKTSILLLCTCAWPMCKRSAMKHVGLTTGLGCRRRGRAGGCKGARPHAVRGHRARRHQLLHEP